jgi:hypothetical protein
MTTNQFRLTCTFLLIVFVGNSAADPYEKSTSMVRSSKSSHNSCESSTTGKPHYQNHPPAMCFQTNGHSSRPSEIVDTLSFD